MGVSEESILKEIADQITDTLSRAGLFHRVFARLKSPASIGKKLKQKAKYYSEHGKKLQDIFGFRVTLYFADDQDIAIALIKRSFQEVSESHSIDSASKEYFGPIRQNLVFRLDDRLTTRSNLFSTPSIDNTFEIQIRTVFSEGWHEVEHDLRYKCQSDWDSEVDLERQLNGQLATLETCNWAMLKIFDELAHTKYKARQWNSFFRNTMRIRFEDESFSDSVLNILDSNPFLAKNLLKADRQRLILPLIGLTSRIPLKMDTVFFIINRTYLKNQPIHSIEPPILKLILEESFPIDQSMNFEKTATSPSEALTA